MSTAITVDQEELELIEKARAEKAKKLAEKQEREEAERLADIARREKQARIDNEKLEIRKTMIEALLKVDKEEWLDEGTIHDNHTQIKGSLSAIKTITIQVVEHTVYGSGYIYRSQNKGYKYLISCDLNSHKRQYYKNPKSVIKKLKDFREIQRNKDEIANHEKRSKQLAIEKVKSLYPKASITFNESIRYARVYRPNRIRAEGENGSVDFTYTVTGEGKVTLKNYNTSIKNTDLNAKIAALILG